MKKINIIKGSQEILIEVLKGKNCNVICRNEEVLNNKIKNFINLLNRFDIKFKIDYNKIIVGKNYVIFSIIKEPVV